MDPNATLTELRSIYTRLQEITDQQDDPPTDDQYLVEYIEKSGRMAELIDALDRWIVMGGFLPQAWQDKAGS